MSFQLFDTNNKPQLIRRMIIAVLSISLATVFIFHSCANAKLMKYEYREGDMIFQPLPHGELVDAIEGATKSEWSHCGVIMREDGKWVVYEAIGPVLHTPLLDWIRRGRDEKFEVYRVKPDTPFDVEKLREALKFYWGKPYDLHYAPDDSAIYCSELIYKAYDRAAGIKIGEWQTLGSLKWQPFLALILSIEPSGVPTDRLMITPVAMTLSKLVERVHTHGGNL